MEYVAPTVAKPAYSPIEQTPVSTPPSKKEETTMSEVKTEGSAWGPLAAGVAGLLLGENGVFGRGSNGGNAVTPDQLGIALNQMQGNMQRDNIQGQISHSSAHLGMGLAGVKEAVAAGSAQNALSLCGLGNSVTQGFAATNFNIQHQASQGRELALQQALDVERQRATELRIQLSEAANNAQHATTQVLVQQLVAKA